MPYRTKDTLETWLDEFQRLGYPLSSSIRVIPHGGEEGSDTGLVAAALGTAPTALYVEPVAAGSTSWQVTFEPREMHASLDAAAVLTLSGELAVLSALCAFFQAKSEAFLAALENA
jgi:hypothetical protein